MVNALVTTFLHQRLQSGDSAHWWWLLVSPQVVMVVWNMNLSNNQFIFLKIFGGIELQLCF